MALNPNHVRLAMLDGNPVIYNPALTEAWMLTPDNKWVTVHPAEVAQNARTVTAKHWTDRTAAYPLPPTAFAAARP